MNTTSVKALFLLSCLIGITLFLIAITSHCILTLDFYKNAGELYADTSARYYAIYQNLQHYIYISSALYILIKVVIITSILYTALYFTGVQIAFLKVLNVVTLAEFIFFIPAIAKIALFHTVYPNGNLADWHRFYLLSALSLIPNVPADWLYALQTVNVFEVGHWFILAYGLFKITHLSFDQSLKVVVSSYLPALVVWVCTITLCSLVMFPTTG